MNKIGLFIKMVMCAIVVLPVLGLVGCKGTYNNVEYSLDEDFDNITLRLDASDVEFLSSEDGKLRVVCSEKKNLTHSVSVKDGSLMIEIVDSRKWYQKIFSAGSSSIIVYLPKSEYSALVVESDTGNVNLTSGFSFDNVNIALSTGKINVSGVGCAGDFNVKVSTGDVMLNDISCKSFTSEGDTGDVAVRNLSAVENVFIKRTTGKIKASNLSVGGNFSTNVSTGDNELSSVTCASFSSSGSTGKLKMSAVVADGQFSIKRSTGNITLDGCDAAEIYIKTSTGDVTGSFLTDKIIFADTSTGKVDIPKLTSGGRCEISTSTGDIKITVEP